MVHWMSHSGVNSLLVISAFNTLPAAESIMELMGLFKTKKRPVIESKDLRIDCRQCGDPSIGKAACLRCIGESIVRFGEPERIILRSGIEIEYSHESAEILRRISDAFSKTSVGRDGKHCSGCVLSSESLEDEKWADLSFENIDDILDRLGKVYIDCPYCQDCVSDAERYFVMLREKLERLSNDALMTAYRIVGD